MMRGMPEVAVLETLALKIDVNSMRPGSTLPGLGTTWFQRVALPTAALLIIAAALPPGSGRAEDVVHAAVGENSRARTRLTGEVLDYTGQTLLLRLPGGTQRAFPAERIFQIETQRTAEHLAGDKLLAERQPAAALEKYRLAMDKEERRWVRREIMSQMVWCHRELGDAASAVQIFHLLLQSDRTTPYFDAIPLAWLPGEPSPTVAGLAQQWLAREDEPAVSLVGASHLLSTAQRAVAIDRLKALSFDRDPRVAALARAQVWRGSLGTANELAIASWTTEVEKLPEALRAGPYFTVGRALAFKQQPQRAAILLMRVPILYPRERDLAGRSLLEAGRELEKIGQSGEAAGLYREVIDSYPQTTLAAEALGRLQGGKSAK